MATDMRDVRGRATQFATGFTSGQKAMSMIAVVAAVAGLGIFFHLSGKPSYQPLFTGLKASDASSITTKLTSDHVAYQLADQGSTILVPAKDVDSERLAMSAAGLPAQGGGFTNLTSGGLTSSTASQQAAYQADLQGELESTIGSISGVTSAQVAIALPQTDTFGVTSASTTTASVLLGLGSGTALTPTQIQSVVHLVASAVPNLSPDQVTVADTSGNVLAAPGVTTSDLGSSTQTATFDSALSAQLQQLVSTVVGPGNVQVQVQGILNYNKENITTNSVLNGKNGKPIAVPTTSSSDSETYSGNGAAAAGGGALGTTTTITPTAGATPTAGSTTAATSAGGYAKTDSTTNYALGTVTKTIQQAPGAIQHLSVAVLVNSKSKVNPATLKSLITTAAGIQKKRGDTITIASMPFSTTSTAAATAAAAAAAKAQKSAGILSIGRTALLVIGIIVLILLLMRSSKSERRTTVDLPLDSDGQLLAGYQAAIGGSSPMAAIAGPRSPAKDSGDLNDFIDGSPDEIADLLRSWTREGSRSA